MSPATRETNIYPIFYLMRARKQKPDEPGAGPTCCRERCRAACSNCNGDSSQISFEPIPKIALISFFRFLGRNATRMNFTSSHQFSKQFLFKFSVRERRLQLEAKLILLTCSMYVSTPLDLRGLFGRCILKEVSCHFV